MDCPRFALSVLVVAACTIEAEEGRADTIPIYFLPDAPRPDEEQLLRAEELLGLELLEAEQRWAAVTIVFYEDGNTGASDGSEGDLREWCSKVIWSGPDPNILAHELGHANGLLHVNDAGNLMHPTIIGEDLTEEQIDTLRLNAWWRLEKC